MTSIEDLQQQVYHEYGANDLSGLLLPLLLELNWGKKKNIPYLALPEKGTTLDLTGFLNFYDNRSFAVTI